MLYQAYTYIYIYILPATFSELRMKIFCKTPFSPAELSPYFWNKDKQYDPLLTFSIFLHVSVNLQFCLLVCDTQILIFIFHSFYMTQNFEISDFVRNPDDNTWTSRWLLKNSITKKCGKRGLWNYDWFPMLKSV